MRRDIGDALRVCQIGVGVDLLRAMSEWNVETGGDVVEGMK